MNPEPAVLNEFFFYQVGNGQLIGSENPFVYAKSDEMLRAMIEHFGIRVLMSLVPVNAEFEYSNVTHYQYPLSGHRVPSIDEVRPIISVLSAHLGRGEVIWCHCERGLDRTGSILGGLLTCQGLSADEATHEILSRFPDSRQSPRMRNYWEPYEKLIGLLANNV